MNEEMVKQEPIDVTALSLLHVSREPAEVLAEARKAACALKDVIETKERKVVLNGKTYLTFEDWQTVSRFYGVSVGVEWTRYIEYGDVKGFEARAYCLMLSNGLQISAADAMCLNDEQNWGMRHTKEGLKLTPLFQLRSMAQTRACAKALRNVLAFVPVLAGYEPTPAEEMEIRGSQEAANEVAARKIAEHEAKKLHATPPEALSDTLKQSIANVEKSYFANQPKARINTAPPPKVMKREIGEREPGDDTDLTFGILREVKLITPKIAGKKAFMSCTLVTPADEEVKFNVFDYTHSYPSGHSLGDLIARAKTKPCMFVLQQSAKRDKNGKPYINFVGVRKLGDLEIDENGPVIQRGAAPPRAEIPEEFSL